LGHPVCPQSHTGFFPTAVHGDLWTSNILWRRDPSSSRDEGLTSELVAIIDWQLVHLGNPLHDLARVLALNVPAQYKRENTTRLLELYIAKVHSYTGGGEYGQPKSLEQVHYSYIYPMAIIAAYSIFRRWTPTVTRASSLPWTWASEC